MNFTREPILESVITPREGCKLVVRNSKVGGQEEYFVDAIEIVSFGVANFYRSLERPKSFLLPVSDYEVLETRETRMMLKAATMGEKTKRGPASPEEEKASKAEKKKPRRTRRRKTKEVKEEPKEEAAPPVEETEAKDENLASILPPPPTLIRESIGRYKEMLDMKPPETETVVTEETEEIAEPALVPPAAVDKEEVEKGVGVFSATRFLRRLTGGEGPPAETE